VLPIRAWLALRVPERRRCPLRVPGCRRWSVFALLSILLAAGCLRQHFCAQSHGDPNHTGQCLVAEGGIVNYYSGKAYMGGHRDDLEYTFDQPVVSLSLGCSAVFLLGGEDKDAHPVPIVLRSGDAVIMGGRSRLCVHGQCSHTLPTPSSVGSV
jgi:alkylated DNA repair dioxygenase AlkB